MERPEQAQRDQTWNGDVRGTVQAARRHRILLVLAAAAWLAAGLMAWQLYVQRGQLEEAQQTGVAAAREEAQRAALQEQVTRLTEENDALRLQLDMAAEAEQAARAQAAAAREALAQAQAPKVDGPAYTALYPELYATSSRRETLSPDYTVYLTFDDGPSARTAEVLDILKANGIKATFFVTGQTGAQAQALMRRIVAEGHTIGVHTYTHDYKEIYASVEAYLRDFDRMYNWVHEVTGVYPQIFRFPGGTVNSYNTDIYRELAAEMTRRGFVHYDWNAACGDADGKTHTTAELAQNSLAMLGAKRVIVLMHDSSARQSTVACLPTVIAGYRNAGYAFAPLTPEVKSITFDR